MALRDPIRPAERSADERTDPEENETTDDDHQGMHRDLSTQLA